MHLKTVSLARKLRYLLLVVVVQGIGLTDQLRGVSLSSLQDLPGVGVDVADLPSAAMEFGLRKGPLMDIMRRALQKAEVPIYSEEELSAAPGSPILELKVMIGKLSGTSGYLYSARLELQEKIALERPTEHLISIYAPTWERTILGVTNGTAHIYVAVEKLLEWFVDEYRKENAD